MKESVGEKAHRLSRLARPIGADVFVVPGNAKPFYFVIVGDKARFCSCRAGWEAFEKGNQPECSHIFAAVIARVRMNTPKGLDPFDDLAGRTRGDGKR